MKKGFITFSVIFILICSINFGAQSTVEGLQEQIIHTNTDWGIYYPALPYYLNDISPFVLGTITDPNILFSFGLLMAQKAKASDSKACVIGYSQVMSDNIQVIQGSFDEVIAPFFSVDPYKASQSIEWITNGLMAGGIFPVLSTKYGLNDELILNLKHKKIFPAILLEDFQAEEQRFLDMAVAVIDYSGEVLYYPSLLTHMDWQWSQKVINEKDLRQEIILAGITPLKKRFSMESFQVFYRPLAAPILDQAVVFFKDPRLINLTHFNTGYLIHSDEAFVLERLRLICSEIYFARGSKNWQ
ncbi:MAG TPA: hypothetical protein PLI77_05075 [Bacteroidales bacterium]|nr:hypothetical protein [Bacteroidales bacterium]HRW33578.1 hypothetical protein [Thermotogota bacterium]